MKYLRNCTKRVLLVLKEFRRISNTPHLKCSYSFEHHQASAILWSDVDPLSASTCSSITGTKNSSSHNQCRAHHHVACLSSSLESIKELNKLGLSWAKRISLHSNQRKISVYLQMDRNKRSFWSSPIHFTNISGSLSEITPNHHLGHICAIFILAIWKKGCLKMFGYICGLTTIVLCFFLILSP